jgi:di/tricarboxylate transporter
LPGFGLLDFAPIGIPIVIVGILFMALIGFKSLPVQSPAQKVNEDHEFGELLNTYQLSERFARGCVRKGGALDGKTLGASQLREKYHLNVIAVHRGKRTLPIETKTVLRGGDILLIVGRPEDTLPDVLQDTLEILPLGTWQDDYLSIPDLILIEAAVAPRSQLAGQTLQEIQFEQKYGTKVLAIWRQGRSIRTRLSNLPLQFGDGLLLQGTKQSLDLLRTEAGFILLAEAAEPTRITARSWIAALIMLATLGLAAMFSSLIGEIMLSGAIGMVMIGALTMDDAYRSVEWRSLFLVGGMLPVGLALTKTGGAALLANAILSAVIGKGAFVLLAVLVLVTVLLTQIMNGAAAVTILAPIGISAAQQLGLEPRAIALAIAIASSMAFMSPLGHSVNVLVMGAGGYTFQDYARVGTPLTTLLVIILLVLLPILMPLK